MEKDFNNSLIISVTHLLKIIWKTEHYVKNKIINKHPQISIGQK